MAILNNRVAETTIPFFLLYVLCSCSASCYIVVTTQRNLLQGEPINETSQLKSFICK